jgi:hypothetical protein
MNPKIDLRLLHQTLPPEDYAIVRRVIDQKSWRLKGARPKIHPLDPQSNLVAYVWRMTAFYLSSNPDHHRMPAGAFFYLPRDADKGLLQRLDRIVDKITDTVPKMEWYGIIAWRGLADLDADAAKWEAKRRLGVPPKPLDSKLKPPVEEPEDDEEPEEFTDEWIQDQAYLHNEE